ncbi:RNA recognition motif containing protein [Cladophialophora carrionii]|uniref:RNA recognition motif containing protein n=1 Tax=Cladophialophora carrionii TaxID=86049 RepID=A0A1C1CXN2_9EURO|nr:RNA recognition motif containing protein [Cladophialophora carrionii]
MAPGQSRSVFVGNIPFNLSEENIIRILNQVGTVVKFRLMTNPDTGKSKGFGFADFQDADQAASAVRNLNDYEIDGRKIRVDWPHNNEKDSVPTNYDQASAPAGDGLNNSGAASALPPLPPGVDLPPNLRATDAISQTLSTLPPPQLLDVLTQMKGLAISDPARATSLLKTAPQLSYAIFQALILMNLVDPKVLAQVVEQAARPAQPAAVAPPQPVPQQYPGYPPVMVPGQMPPRPPPQQYAPPAMPQQQQPPPQPQQQPQISHQEMIQQVLAMDQRTIDSFSPAERAQIMQIRASMGVR